MYLTDTFDDAHWVVAAPFRAHVRQLMLNTGQPWRVIAVATDVPAKAIHTLLFGRDGKLRRKISATDALKLARMEGARFRHQAQLVVPAHSTRRIIAHMRTSGFSVATIADYLMITQTEVHLICTAELTRCLQLVAWRTEAAAQAHQLLSTVADVAAAA